ncbi:hypothetical protein HOG98_08260 [bacterium]|jgi:hypothetical protein|nr:hypothetical protein [bacterium]
MIQTIIFGSLLMGLCFFGFGVGVFVFGKSGKREKCGTDPTQKHQSDEECPSQKHGLCPTIDTQGAAKMLNQSRLNFPKGNDE